jgi:polyisoprenoid-binding protein YceI
MEALYVPLRVQREPNAPSQNDPLTSCGCNFSIDSINAQGHRHPALVFGGVTVAALTLGKAVLIVGAFLFERVGCIVGMLSAKGSRTIVRARGFLLAGLLLICAAGITHAAEWRMDLAGSKLEYTATLQKTRASGIFNEFEMRARFDESRLADSRADVTVVVASADMIDAEVNKAMRGLDWFDSARFPQAEFHTSDIRRVGQNSYLARGALTVKGIEQQIEVPFVWTNEADTATITGELTVKRAAFRIGLGEWASTDVVGPDVTVKFRVRLRRTG